MANFTIAVSWNGSAPTAGTATTGTTLSDNFYWYPASGSGLTSLSINSLPTNVFSMVSSTGSLAQYSDTGATGEYSYYIAAYNNGSVYTSTDPQIINNPGNSSMVNVAAQESGDGAHDADVSDPEKA